MKLNCLHTCFTVACSLLLLQGCGASIDGDGPAPEQSAEEVAVSQEALYESTCWTSTTPDATVVAGTPPGCGGGGIIPLTYFTATSPSGSYNHATCPSQYVVEVTNVLNKGFTPYVHNPAHTTTVNQDWCPGFWSRAEAKGWKNNQWTSLGTANWVGIWVDGGDLPDYCGLSGTGFSSLQPNHGYSKILLAAQAGFATVLTSVRAGVSVGASACP